MSAALFCHVADGLPTSRIDRPPPRPLSAVPRLVCAGLCLLPGSPLFQPSSIASDSTAGSKPWNIIGYTLDWRSFVALNQLPIV